MVIHRLDGEDEALKFIAAHKHLTTFRAMLIEYYIQEEDLATALALIQEGQDELRRERVFPHGTATMYRMYILKIAQARGDTPTIIDQARALWLGRAGDDYFHLLKQTILPAEWPKFRDDLVADKACPPELVAWVCAEEGVWPRLRDIVIAHPYLLPHYQLDLEKHYPDEMAHFYKALAMKKLEKVSNRPTYQEAASLLIRMRLLGHGDEGKAVARQLIEQHSQRRAMIDELKRVL